MPEQELAGYLEGGALSTLHVAFSREGTTKDYVQVGRERQGLRLDSVHVQLDWLLRLLLRWLLQPHQRHLLFLRAAPRGA